MDSKELRLFREAYSSIHEGYDKKKKGGCVDKEDKGEHNCAKKVCHESFGEGECIFGEHAVPDENGFVSHYDVMFEHGIERNVPVADMEVLEESSHNEENHRYEGEQIAEADLFDIVKGHLMSEGYADTEEAALAIMANMSEEWRQSIIEAGLPIPPGGIKPDRMNPVDQVTGKSKYKMITGPTGKPREIENPSFGMVKGV
jgi:hypothetical protein